MTDAKRDAAPPGRKLAGPLSTALAIAVGIAIAWGCLTGWLLQFVNRRAVDHWESVQVRADGTPIIARTHPGTILRADYFTLDRKPIPGPDGPEIMAAQAAKGLSESAIRPLTEPLILGYSDCRPRPVVWYFVDFGNPAGNGYFAGYDVATRRGAGYIGRQGFQATEPVAGQTFEVHRTLPYGTMASFIAPFRNSQQAEGTFWPGKQVVAPGAIPAWICHLVSGDRLFRIDLRERSVEAIFEAPGLVSVSMAQQPLTVTASRSREYDDCLVVRSQTAVTVLDWKGRVERTYPLPEELASFWFNFFPAANGKAVATFADVTSRRYANSLNVVEFSPEGKVARTTPHVTDARRIRENPSEAAWMSLVVPEPIVPLVITLALSPFLSDADRQPAGSANATAEALAFFWPMLVITSLLGAVSVALYRRHAVLCGNRPTVPWMVFVFLCGVPGLLGYRAHRRWPVRLPCPTCKADVPRSRGNCVRCGAEFLPPAPTGREIFA